jgi:hypothetical protein
MRSKHSLLLCPTSKNIFKKIFNGWQRLGQPCRFHPTQPQLLA